MRTKRRTQNKKNIKIFVTYGNKKFKKSRERLDKEAQSLNLFDKTIIETDVNIKKDSEFKEGLKNDNFKKVFNKKRGGGYWIWKPYIIYKNLKLLKKNDILVYADAGCTIKKNSYNNFTKTFKRLKNGKNKILLNKLKATNDYSISELKEKMWCKGDVLKYYNVYNNDKILNSTQFEGGRIFILKNDKTMKIFRKLWNTAKKYPELFDDSKSKIENKEDFIEARHDQSNISLLCKISDNCTGIDLDFISATRISD